MHFCHIEIKVAQVELYRKNLNPFKIYFKILITTVLSKNIHKEDNAETLSEIGLIVTYIMWVIQKILISRNDKIVGSRIFHNVCQVHS